MTKSCLVMIPGHQIYALPNEIYPRHAIIKNLASPCIALHRPRPIFLTALVNFYIGLSAC